MARSADPMSYAAAVTFIYFAGIPNGVLRPDDRACARSRMHYGLPNDPAMISRWSSPG